MGLLLLPILQWVYQAVLGSLDAVTGVITGALLITPEVTGLPQVQALTGRSVAVVDAVFVLVFLAAGLLTTIAGGDELSRTTVKDLLPRGIVAFVAAHFSQLICAQLIPLANALCKAVAEDDVTDALGLRALRQNLAPGADPGVVLLFCVLVVLLVVLLVSTTFSMLTRFGVVLVLTAAAPIALACHALPQTDPVARLWWRAYLGALATPIVQAFVLTAGKWMLTDPQAMLPELHFPGNDNGVQNLFVVLVLLWTTVRVPGLVRRYVMAANRPNVWGAVVRVLAVRRLAGFL